MPWSAVWCTTTGDLLLSFSFVVFWSGFIVWRHVQRMFEIITDNSQSLNCRSAILCESQYSIVAWNTTICRNFAIKTVDNLVYVSHAWTPPSLVGTIFVFAQLPSGQNKAMVRGYHKFLIGTICVLASSSKLPNSSVMLTDLVLDEGTPLYIVKTASFALCSLALQGRLSAN